MRRLLRPGGPVFLILCWLVAAPALAQHAPGSWLDTSQPASWNEAGQAIPLAPPLTGSEDPRFPASGRPVATPEDQAVVGAGWRLFGAYQAGWGVTIVQGLSGYDGMGRPLGYQAFVFVDGAFAGTLSPDPMDSRTDGALDAFQLYGLDNLIAEYRRYAPDDPLCCPAAKATVQFRLEPTPAGPVVAPVSVSQEQVGPPPTAAPAGRLITIEQPPAGAPFASGDHVRGRGTVGPFENTLTYRVYDEDNQIVGAGPITVTPDVEGTLGGPYRFEAPIVYQVQRSGIGWIEIADPNAAGGPPHMSVSVRVMLQSPSDASA